MAKRYTIVLASRRDFEKTRLFVLGIILSVVGIVAMLVLPVAPR